MKCPLLVMKLAELTINDVEDYMRQNIPDKQESMVNKMIESKLEEKVLLRNPGLVLGIGNERRQDRAARDIGDQLMGRYPALRKKYRENRLEDDRITKAVNEIIGKEMKSDSKKLLAIQVLKALT